MDMLVEQTHDLRYEWRNNERPLRFTDTRVDEQSRGISLKSTPMSLILEGSNGKSFLMNLVDTPGTQAFFNNQHIPAVGPAATGNAIAGSSSISDIKPVLDHRGSINSVVSILPTASGLQKQLMSVLVLHADSSLCTLAALKS